LAAALIAEEDGELYRVLLHHADEAVKGLLSHGVAHRHSILEVYG
jgi:hypothetical protein